MECLNAEVFLDGGFKFLEGPRWYEDRLWFSDMFGCKVYAASTDGSFDVIATIPGRPSGLGFLPGGVPVVASMMDRKLYKLEGRLEGGNITLHADLSSHVVHHINDLVMDKDGRAYVGHFGFDLWNSDDRTALASIVTVSPNGDEVRIAAGDLHFPNGMVFTSDGRLVVAETFSHRLTAFELASSAAPGGTLVNRHVFAPVPDAGPDGLAIDADDGVWVAAVDQSRFIRVMEGGEITREVRVDGRHAVACTLGGARMDKLFCLTTSGSWSDVAACKSSSRVEVVSL